MPLPEWAPKNPSPEFLRAAKVLEPDLPEFFYSRDKDDLAVKASWARYSRTLPAAWELFGTLSDEQIEAFLTVREVRIPVKDLSHKQRAMLNHYFEVWRKVFKGVSAINTEFGDDWLVGLYKLGANEDLSNVLLVYRNQASGIAAMMLRVPNPGGDPPSLNLPARLGLVRSQRRDADD